MYVESQKAISDTIEWYARKFYNRAGRLHDYCIQTVDIEGIYVLFGYKVQIRWNVETGWSLDDDAGNPEMREIFREVFSREGWK